MSRYGRSDRLDDHGRERDERPADPEGFHDAPAQEELRERREKVHEEVDPRECLQRLRDQARAVRRIDALLSALDASPAGDTDKLFTIGRVMRNYGNGQCGKAKLR